jgi:hypothetical protein
VPPILWFLNRFPFFLFLHLFLTPFLGFLAAEFPDDAAGAEFAVEAGVGAGPASIQALLAVADLHFLADDAGVPSHHCGISAQNQTYPAGFLPACGWRTPRSRASTDLPRKLAGKPFADNRMP